MPKSNKRAQRRPERPESPPSPAHQAPAPQSFTPLWFRPVATYVLGAAYIATAITLLVLSHREESRIGAVCGEACGGTTLLGFSLEWWGGGLMLLVLLMRWLATRMTDRIVAQLLMVSVLGHAGASLAFAGSQWLGIVPVCPLCQVAAFFSLTVALTCLPMVRVAFEAPLIPALQSLALGLVGVIAIWPALDGLKDEAHTEEHPAPIAHVLPSTTPTAAPTTAPDAPSEGLRAAMDAMTIGDPNAPYELVMITDFECSICQRFERDQLPQLIREGVDTGDIRVRFLLTRRAAAATGPYYELIAATSLAMAGLGAIESFEIMRTGRLLTAPQGIARATDTIVRDRAMEIMREVSDETDWEQVIAEHTKRARDLRQTYFPGRGGTPVFIMSRGPLDTANLPPPDDENVLPLFGFQLAESFLKFAGKSQ